MPRHRANHDAYSLPVANGLADLRPGSHSALRRYLPHDFVTVATAVPFDRAQDTSYVDALVREITGSEPNYQFTCAWFGYCTTGSNKEHKLLIQTGKGRNGKSTILKGVMSALGQWAGLAPDGLLESSGKFSDASDNSKMFAIAGLRNKRLQYIPETGERGRFSEAKVKRLTGETTVKGRPPGGEYVDYHLECKFTIGTQHPGGLDGNDYAVMERLLIQHFPNVYGTQEQMDAPGSKVTHLAKKGLEELVESDDPKLGRRAWLAWLIKVCAPLWIEHGLDAFVTPDMRKAVQQHAEDNNLVQLFARDVFAPISDEELKEAKRLEASRKAGDKCRIEWKGTFATFVRWCQEHGRNAYGFEEFRKRFTADELFGEARDVDGATGEVLKVRRVSLGKPERIPGSGSVGYFYRYLRWNAYGASLYNEANGTRSTVVVKHGDTPGAAF